MVREDLIRLKNVFNMSVSLKSDPAFLGYLFGESYPPDPVLGPVMVVYIKEQGATGKRGIRLFPLSDLVKVERVMR
jgi:hypothetical protein